ncbi:MAG TPA: hypothetical protein VG248_03150 [Caulobacteraceae bacterium]|jgi:hypothetical protein|nr:hypothetical protein [Caulobacteraceae bacterium]
MSYESSPAPTRAEALDAIPAMLTVLRRMVITAFEAGDPESDELRRLLDACVVGAHRLRLREQMRAKGGCKK